MTVVSSPIRKMKEFLLITCVLFFQQQLKLLHAAPPIEPCPHDSILVEDTCKCNPSSCSKPPCLHNLVIAANSTDEPGHCCPIYTCEGCPNSTLIDGKCPCAPNATLDALNTCKCVDPHRKLLNGECVCDEDLCELPQLCDINSVSVTEQTGCCPTTKCIKCPDDSFATSNKNGEIEDKCVCYPCPKECGPGEKVVIVQRGKGFPGSCCDMYKCEKDDSEKKCLVDGVWYGEGDILKTSDTQVCKCQDGLSFCWNAKNEEFFRPCHKEGKVYKHDESWMLDTCTNCTCFNGETKCIAHTCEVSQGHIDKPDCQALNCSKVCVDGFKLNKRGCPICKCNSLNKYDDILHKFNITKSELREILEDYFARNRTISTSTTVETGVSGGDGLVDGDGFTTPVTELDENSQLVTWIVPTIILAILVGTLVVLGFRWWCCTKKGRKEPKTARSTTYERIKLTKPTMFNNNYIGNNNKDEQNVKNIKGSV
ncbi:cysteine-rich motor neuron 1 protein [Tribolium madens]|uniref:cysteine-rich motor neuron 1 protein n=1 Tax=Tribolium madens TaxID=41895 RepID=UPI001CF72E63|nr:cysteine-rich motor neuron 1 protein [Tribolium madens]